MRGYSFDNAAPAGPAQLGALAELLDPGSQARTRGLLDLRGKRCLEVGAGSGSFALWLAEQVGDGGYVMATDIKPELIPVHPRLDRVRHDLTVAAPPEEDWDFIHARCVLSHLPSRRHILHRLVGALAPGGVILIEDWQSRPPQEFVAAARHPADRALVAHFQHAVASVLYRRGRDNGWAASVCGLLVEEGLIEVETVVSASTWRGGGAGCRHALATLDQLRGDLLDAAVTETQLDRLAELLTDPGLILHGRLLHSTSARKPPS